MSLHDRQKTKNHSDQQGSHLKASVRCLVYSRLSGLQPGGVVVVTSSFSDSIVFAVHTRKTAFSDSTVFKSLHSGERFRDDPFSLIVFGVVVWTVAVSGTKQYRFRFKTVLCGRGLNFSSFFYVLITNTARSALQTFG